VTGTSTFTTSAANATITLTQANLFTGAVSMNTNGASGNASLTNNQALVLAQRRWAATSPTSIPPEI